MGYSQHHCRSKQRHTELSVTVTDHGNVMPDNVHHSMKMPSPVQSQDALSSHTSETLNRQTGNEYYSQLGIRM